jgi:hypothetical protein
MDWDVLGNYTTHVGVGVHVPACGRYLACAHCAAVMAGITPAVVSAGLDRALALPRESR